MNLEQIQDILQEQLPAIHYVQSANGTSVPVFGFRQLDKGQHDNDNLLGALSASLLCLEPYDACDRAMSDTLAQYANLALRPEETVPMELFRTIEAPAEHEFVRHVFEIMDLPPISSEMTGFAQYETTHYANLSPHSDTRSSNTVLSKWNASPKDTWQAAIFVRRTIRERYTAFLEQHADTHLLKLCSTIPLSHRLPVYRFAVGNVRRIQLVKTHPLLACTIANDLRLLAHVWEIASAGTPALMEASKDDLTMIDTGAPLRDICRKNRIPYWLRRLPMHPQLIVNEAAQLEERGYKAGILNAMPAAPHQVGEWVSYLIRTAQALTPAAPVTEETQRRVDSAKLWMINNCMKLTTNDLDRNNKVTEALDYIAAPQDQYVLDRLYQANPGDAAHIRYDDNGLIAPLEPDQAINPDFSPDISTTRLAQQIEAWHMALAKKQADDAPPFPKAPFAEVEVGSHRLAPIEDAFELFMEGKTMHHCVATYTGRILAGESYIYRFTKDGAPLGTVEMSMGFPLTMKQVSGHCNKAIPTEDLAVLHAIIHMASIEIEADREAKDDASGRLNP